MLTQDNGILLLQPERKVDYHHAELDANAINFYLPEPYRYFSIAVGIFLGGNDALDQPDFEIGDQQMHRGPLQAVIFSPGEVTLEFGQSKPFLKRYHTVRLFMNDMLDRKMVDFFVNDLFFGEIARYAKDFDPALRVQQTEFRQRLDELDE